MSGAIDTAITGGSAFVALLALVVAYLARRDARRSADASERSATAGEQSAKHARRSADAAERGNDLVARDAEQRAADRHNEAGPTFTAAPAHVSDRMARVTVTVINGPGRVVIDAEPDAPWCAGISAGAASSLASSIRFPPLEPGDDLTLTVHLTTDPWEGHRQIVLPLRLTVESREDPPRTWERRVSVPLRPAPPAPVPVSNSDPVPDGF